MCTLVALHRCVPDAFLWIAANRDEYLERPAEGPALRDVGGVAVVAPLDLRAGGTWWGVTAYGVFAALTNRPTASPDVARRSRGQLVLDALASPTARRAADSLAGLGADLYNPFNLFVADAHDAFAVVYERSPAPIALAPGVHVIGNADPNAREVAKIRRTIERAESVAAGPADRIEDGLAAICRSHEAGDDPLASTCVHRGGYGTRSSTLLRLGGRALLHHADGPPCTHPYRNFTPLLAELGAPAELGTGETATRMAS
ncbi:MAG: hypothetical protein DCC71_20345 [Proteobacteria bacterium]|nr:MAG: hypothetical protein DCC71_20345 [Pseudomonadota bacterium]